MKDKFYITTPIFYASGKLHLGHVYTATACDVLARWNRQIGKEVFFLTGSDEHGQKVQKKAEEKGIEPELFVEGIVKGFKDTLKKMNISYDYFIRTIDPKHKEFIQKMLQKAYDNGDIYKGVYKGLYCVDCEQYYKEVDLIDSKNCPVHKREVNEVEEENYFFKLSKYEKKLLDLYKKNKDFLSPNSKAQETINRIKEGLEDISISRSKKTLSWGVELPFDKTHVTYVWFDALFNYVSALEIEKKEDFWPCNIHVVGKDIMWFHKVYWPAFLMSCGYEVPQKVFAHGWWTVEGEKMGKSMDNVIEPLKIVKEFGLEEFRYFMMSSGTFGEDLDFSREVFIMKINNELNNDLGNLVSRVHAMTGKYFEGVVPEIQTPELVDLEILRKCLIEKEFTEHMDNLSFHKALDLLWSVIRELNAYVNKVEPWKEKDENRLKTIMNVLCSCICEFNFYLKPFMPEKSEMIEKQFNFSNVQRDNIEKGCIDILEGGFKLNEKVNIFEKFKEEKKEEKIEVKREGFSSLCLKVGEIKSVRQHPEAEKLYIEEIDLGNGDMRQIVSGLKDYYELTDMECKKVVVVANLKPAKLRGERSEGMVLVSEDEKNNKVGLLLPDCKIGECLEVNGEVADNDKRISIDDFFKVKLTSDGKKVYFDKKEVTAKGKSIVSDRGIVGDVR